MENIKIGGGGEGKTRRLGRRRPDSTENTSQRNFWPHHQRGSFFFPAPSTKILQHTQRRVYTFLRRTEESHEEGEEFFFSPQLGDLVLQNSWQRFWKNISFKRAGGAERMNGLTRRFRTTFLRGFVEQIRRSK